LAWRANRRLRGGSWFAAAMRAVHACGVLRASANAAMAPLETVADRKQRRRYVAAYQLFKLA